jgi:BlaI family transcriptional regulator, penicillinase repressor
MTVSESADGRGNGKASVPRRSLLELAPLELDCMNTLWPMGEATVREIRDQLASRRPRAYTTIMTIMDRLARKGVVERRKVGRAYYYRPNLSAEEARTHALGQVVDSFFGGSTEALLEQLGDRALTRRAARPRVESAQRPDEHAVAAPTEQAVAAPAEPEPPATSRIDTTLL